MIQEAVKPAWTTFQNDIYRHGSKEGLVPALPTNMLELERQAIATLSPEAAGYIAASAGDSETSRENRRAIDRWKIVPRMMLATTARDTLVNVAGETLAAPLMLAPVGVQSLAHGDGELATARAAATLGLTYIHSQAASHDFEEVAQAAGEAPRWFQFYWVTDPDVCLSFLERAKRSGYTGLVLTADTTMLGWRPADLDRAYLPFLRGIGVQNYTSDPAFMAAIPAGRRRDIDAIADRWLDIFPHTGLEWNQLSFLRENWDGPILIKGILHPDDARKAVDAGMNGVIVSNHGGRQIDGSIGSFDALPAIVQAVDAQASVMIDSGVRTGADVFKAVALGAQAALLGRSVLYGLALAGQAGVEHVLRCTLAEFELTMALSGCRSIAEISADHIRQL